MRKIKISALFMLTGFLYGFAIADNSCFSCAVESEVQCETSSKKSSDIAFVELYKYNHPNFSLCDWNNNTSLANFENDLALKIAELQKHDNHLDYLTSSIKRKHQYLVNSNTSASFSYSVFFDTQAAKPAEIVNYGIKVPWVK